MKGFCAAFVVILIVACQQFGPDSNALLAETGVQYQVLSCHGGIRERKMYCDLAIAPSAVAKLAHALDLDKSVSNAGPSTRIIYLPEGEPFNSPELNKKVDDAFRYQLWRPSRHGFAGAFLIYDSKSGIGRLWLSLAYG